MSAPLSVAATPSLDDPLSVLPGAGPRTTARLVAHGLGSIGELLWHLPRGYDDLRRVTPISALRSVAEGTVVLVRGVVKRVRIFPHRFLDVFVEEGDGDGHGDGGGGTGQGGGRAATVRARWFRPTRGMDKSFVKGTEVALAGPVRVNDQQEVELIHPSNLSAQLIGSGAAPAGAPLLLSGLGIRARYPAVPGVTGRVLEKIIGAAVDRYAETVGDLLAPAARDRLALPGVAASLRALHRPPVSLSGDALGLLAAGRSPAHRRLALDELLILQLGFAGGRRRARAQPARACDADLAATMSRVRAAFPFVLTGAQERVIAEIGLDMAAPRPMQRLLVGDVGSGKTAVAFAAAALAAASGGQTLLMVPTEVLADQHLRTLSAIAARLPGAPALQVARLTAATARAERDATLAGCRAGRIHLLVGTQALLDERVILPDLRLAIIDEQHRFGVAQRARLRRAEPGGAALLPHLLVMSATPIPRTLALTLYGDLDASVLGELPPGRQPPVTELFRGADQRRQAYQRLRERVAQGEQAFVVCPARDQVARPGAVTAVARYAELRRELAADGVRVGLVHGELDSARKESVLRSFAAGATQVLVATTVVELGIDVPGATVMLIEEADRFGLAQLHQLRGRVGRGPVAGVCLLCTAAPAEGEGEGDGDRDDAALGRLRALGATSDGFRIAEADLASRGHGDLFGVRQAGLPRLRFAQPGTDLAGYLELLELARAEADRIWGSDPELERPEHRALRDAVEARWSTGGVFAEEAG